jgi:NAD(P)H-hydrate epimerase
MADIDRRTIAEFGLPGMVLMERAALACVDRIVARALREQRALVLAGPGNNGGDGYAIARLLALRGWQVTVVAPLAPADAGGDAARQRELALRAGAGLVEGLDEAPLDAPIWVDALLGIGGVPRTTGPVAELIESAARCLRSQAPRPWVLAVDLPSGVATDTGVVPGAVIPADLTVTFGAKKWCHLLSPAVDACGETVVADIGFPPAFVDALGARHTTLAEAAPSLPQVRGSAHKGSRGTVVLVCGCDEMPGAAALAAAGALRSGVGLVALGAPASVRSLVQARHPEVVGLGDDTLEARVSRAGALLVGPGLGAGAEGLERARRALAATSGLVVIDADGLNAVARGDLDAPPGSVVTPHPLELARLLGVGLPDVLGDLVGATESLARARGWVVVAKAAGAVVAGGGAPTQFAGGAEPALGCAGSGDVLAGLLAGLLARGVERREAASLAVCLHHGAGVRAARGRGVAATAVDIAESLPAVMAELGARGCR